MELKINNTIQNNINDIINIEKTLTNKIVNKLNKEKLKKYNIEHFEGIRKDNSRLIFGILLTFIIIDLVYSMICH
jgi:hypothetical protein